MVSLRNWTQFANYANTSASKAPFAGFIASAIESIQGEIVHREFIENLIFNMMVALASWPPHDIRQRPSPNHRASAMRIHIPHRYCSHA